MNIIQHAKEEIRDLEEKIKTNYQRGDAELLINAKMFLSIMEISATKEKELGRKLTTEEGHNVLRDHGWTVKRNPFLRK